MKLIIKPTPKIYNYWLNNKHYYAIQDERKFIEFFFMLLLDDPKNKTSIELTHQLDEANACLFSIQNDNEMLYKLSQDKLNILICVENCPQYSHYKHYNKYKDYGNPYLHIYFYNHISNVYESPDKSFIAIPMIHVQLFYFLHKYNNIQPRPIPFEQKKTCLITTSLTQQGPLLQKKHIIFQQLKQLFGESIDQVSIIKETCPNDSCYHSQALMNLFQHYKFVFVAENSIGDGYITEKIFNAFFSRTIPIYLGTHTITQFFNDNSYINANDLNNPSVKDKILNLASHKSDYEAFIKQYDEGANIKENIKNKIIPETQQKLIQFINQLNENIKNKIIPETLQKLSEFINQHLNDSKHH